MKKIFIYILVLFVIMIPLSTNAELENPSIHINNPFNCGGQSPCTVFALISAILSNIIMPIAAVFVVIWIIYAGFQFVIAQGKPGEISKAGDNLLWSLISAGILLGAAGIAEVVKNTVSKLLS